MFALDADEPDPARLALQVSTMKGGRLLVDDGVNKVQIGRVEEGMILPDGQVLLHLYDVPDGMFKVKKP